MRWAVTGRREDSMNTLEMYSIACFESLTVCVYSVRNLKRHVQRQTVVDWVEACALGVFVGIFAVVVLNLLTHPAQNLAVSALLSWLMGFSFVFFLPVLLVRPAAHMGRRLRLLGR
jgi:hypothetical protein